MFLKKNRRKKNGRVFTYYSIVENKRCAGGKTVQRQVLYLGEINDSQKLAWRKTISVIDNDGKDSGTGSARQVALFPADCGLPERPGSDSVDIDHLKVDLGAMELRRPRQWGACWLALELWSPLELDKFFAPRLPSSRKGTDWHKTLQILVAARLIKPASEWYVHREWYRQSAMADLLSLDPDITPKNALYDCHDHPLEHKRELFRHLSRRWKDLFAARFEACSTT